MAILLTGGAGFIGRNLAKRLIEADIEVVIFDLNIEKFDATESDNIVLIKGDVTNLEELEAVCKKYSFDTIFHLAALLPPMTEEDPYKAFKVNVEGSLNVFEVARKFEIKTVIYPSSASVFGPDRKPPFKLEDLHEPWTMYSSFKVCSEIIGSIYAKMNPVNFRAVRFPVIVGPGRSPFIGVTKYPTQMVEEAVKGKPYIADVDPDTEVPIIYIDDAIQVLINLWRSKDIHFEIINVDGIWVSAKEIAEGIKKFIPNAEITFKPIKDENVQKVLTGVKKVQDEETYSFRGKRLLDEILGEYISREKTKEK